MRPHIYVIIYTVYIYILWVYIDLQYLKIYYPWNPTVEVRERMFPVGKCQSTSPRFKKKIGEFQHELPKWAVKNIPIPISIILVENGIPYPPFWTAIRTPAWTKYGWKYHEILQYHCKSWSNPPFGPCFSLIHLDSGSWSYPPVISHSYGRLPKKKFDDLWGFNPISSDSCLLKIGGFSIPSGNLTVCYWKWPSRNSGCSH